MAAWFTLAKHPYEVGLDISHSLLSGHYLFASSTMPLSLSLVSFYSTHPSCILPAIVYVPFFCLHWNWISILKYTYLDFGHLTIIFFSLCLEVCIPSVTQLCSNHAESNDFNVLIVMTDPVLREFQVQCLKTTHCINSLGKLWKSIQTELNLSTFPHH